MFRLDPCLLGVAAITITAGCLSLGPSASGDEDVPPAVSRQDLSLQGPTTRPPPTQVTSELGAPPVAERIDPNVASAALGDRSVRTQLRAVALEVATNTGVPQPKKMHAVAVSDHQAAETLLSGAIIDDHAPVYVVRMTGGRFTATHHPLDAPAPQGDVLTVTVDAATGRVTDIGIVDKEPDLSQLGPTMVDLSTP